MCYNHQEVSTMEQEMNDNLIPEENSAPRPKWQRLLAWVGLGVFIGFLIMYYVIIFRGGK